MSKIFPSLSHLNLSVWKKISNSFYIHGLENWERSQILELKKFPRTIYFSSGYICTSSGASYFGSGRNSPANKEDMFSHSWSTSLDGIHVTCCLTKSVPCCSQGFMSLILWDYTWDMPMPIVKDRQVLLGLQGIDPVIPTGEFQGCTESNPWSPRSTCPGWWESTCSSRLPTLSHLKKKTNQHLPQNSGTNLYYLLLQSLLWHD